MNTKQPMMFAYNRTLKVCRICLISSNSSKEILFVSIFGPDHHIPSLHDIIFDTLAIKIEKNDEKSKLICRSCLDSLKTWIEMKKKLKFSFVVKSHANKSSTVSIFTQSTSRGTGQLDENNVPCQELNTTENVIDLTSDNEDNTDNTFEVSTFTQSTSGTGQFDENTTVSIFTQSTSRGTGQLDKNNVPCQELNTTENVIDLISDNEDNMDNTANGLETNNLNDSSNTNLLTENPTQLNIKKKNQWKPMYKYSLFTCLKPNCNEIFKCFTSFKFHYRQHFTSGPLFMCWNCCSTFINRKHLQKHKKVVKCKSTSLFQCFHCSTTFDNIQSLSIHKICVHNGKLKLKRNIIIYCPICKKQVLKKDFQNHLIRCDYIKNKNINTNCSTAGTSSSNK